MSTTRSSRLMWLAGITLASVALAWLVTRGTPEPVVRGEPMSWWLTTGANNFPAEYRSAVSEMDDHSVKYLIRQLAWQPPTIRIRINKLLAPVFRRNVMNEEQPDYRHRAAETLGKMGDRAKSAIPALQIVAAQTGTNQSEVFIQSAAIGALVLLKAQSPDSLISRIADPKNSNWEASAFATLYVHTNMASSVPKLVETYKALPDEATKGRIAIPLRFIHSDPARSVPVLIELLSHSDPSVQFQAAIGLREFGPAAKTAVPALTNLLSHPNKRTQEAAKIALKRINPESDQHPENNRTEQTN